MNKKLLAVVFVIIALVGITSFVTKRTNELLLQGEVDTKTVDLSSKVPGRVKKLHVKKGDIVKPGQVLVTLDMPDVAAKATQSDAMLDLAMAQEDMAQNGARNEQRNMAMNTMMQAQAAADLAQKTYNRMVKLQAEGVISVQKLDEVSAQYKAATRASNTARWNYQMVMNGTRSEEKRSAMANVKRARGAVSEVNSYLNENTIKAPIGGQITDIAVEEGELVGSGYPIITIVDENDNWVVLNLREDYLKKIRMGTQFNVQIPALSDDLVPVKVNYISAMGNFATWRATKIRGDFDMKTFEVRAVPVNKVDGLRAGMTALVDWNKVQ